jgi:transcription elongation GreA/GreB family factor
MQIISIPISPLEVQFGSTVELRRGDKMMRVTIVGEDEAEPADGLIAWTSPLARAIEGAEVGELILLDGRGEPEKIEILALRG